MYFSLPLKPQLFIGFKAPICRPNYAEIPSIFLNLTHRKCPVQLVGNWPKCYLFSFIPFDRCQSIGTLEILHPAFPFNQSQAVKSQPTFFGENKCILLERYFLTFINSSSNKFLQFHLFIFFTLSKRSSWLTILQLLTSLSFDL